ncbi:hypothetical protein BZG36_05237 [Bifiguratus adelaidae]|uniref:FAD dependent oxidoreductase domain-containing protein n=1 Tax=Bifiguratus adelaidae TaxID=1938954 RepID=A0A261XT86_9FUNG|nr:hypothetical protein BZG36_05237 [Bifiguratus adelaidae]
MARLAVLGAGVSGLTTALVLLKRGHSVVIVAEHFPGDESIEYTSPWAGAHWRSMAANSDVAAQTDIERDAVTFRLFYKWATLMPAECGIMIVQALDYYDTLTDEVQRPWWKDLVSNFRFLEASELPQGAKIGHAYTTVCINTAKYLRFLFSQVLAMGAKIQRRRLSHLYDAFAQDASTDGIINCCAVGKPSLSTHQPFAPLSPMSASKDFITYIIPRTDGTCVIGGTTQYHNDNPEIDASTAHSIMHRAYALCPELSGGKGPTAMDVVRHAVGLRPMRQGGVRIELEEHVIEGKWVTIVHNYGHGGFGYQASIGCAQDAVHLVEKGLLDRQQHHRRLKL